MNIFPYKYKYSTTSNVQFTRCHTLLQSILLYSTNSIFTRHITIVLTWCETMYTLEHRHLNQPSEMKLQFICYTQECESLAELQTSTCYVFWALDLYSLIVTYKWLWRMSTNQNCLCTWSSKTLWGQCSYFWHYHRIIATFFSKQFRTVGSNKDYRE